MRRPIITTGITVAVIGMLLGFKPHARPAATATVSPTGSGPSTADGSAASPASPAGDGTFTGDAVMTRFGAVQVRITVADGRLTGVTVVQAPERDGRDREINAFALPVLTREALAAGSAEIDSVSGATYTSEGYVGSLQSALDQARG